MNEQRNRELVADARAYVDGAMRDLLQLQRLLLQDSKIAADAYAVLSLAFPDAWPVTFLTTTEEPA